MPDTAEPVAKAARLVLPVLAGVALLGLAYAATGLCAVVAAAIGGSIIGGALLAPFFPNDECNPPDGICPPATGLPTPSGFGEAGIGTHQPPIAATVGIRFPTPPPGSDLPQRAATLAAATAEAAANALAAGTSPTGRWIERTAAATAQRHR